MAMNRATQILAAYVNDQLVVLLLAEISGESRRHQKFFEKLYVRMVDFVQKRFFESGAGVYDDTCTWQFYEHSGFTRMEEQKIVLDLPKGNVPLNCFLYSKTL